MLLVSTEPESNLEDVFGIPLTSRPTPIPGVSGRAAVDGAAAGAQKVGDLVAVHVIPRPHDDLEKYLDRIAIKLER